ncbi:MAG: histidine phosphatase family protein [Dehalococcoidia bacterium]|nr:MAG: histidine phosphatase family protein [Dehalococcoidia bacterium]
MPVVWFIRHAESQANAGQRTSDPAQIELTPDGEEQARHIASAFTQAPALIVTSPYVRTKQTALFTQQRFSPVKREEWPIQEFTYLAPARCVNMTASERRPLAAAYWQRNDPAYVDGIGAESFAGLMHRVEELLNRLWARSEEQIAIFSHGQFIRAVIWRLWRDRIQVSGDTMKEFRSFLELFPLPNGAIIQVNFSEGEVWLSQVITSHLTAEFRT